MCFLRISLFAFLLLLLPATASADAQEGCSYQEPDRTLSKYGEARAYYRDWLAACRPDGYCSVNAYLPSETGAVFGYQVRIGRAVKGLDYELILTAVDHMMAPQSSITLAIDDEPAQILDAGADDGWFTDADRSVNEYVIGQSRANLAIIPAMLAGSRMLVGWEDQAGQNRGATVSLMGLTAALCWIDQQQ